ncbi:hypothetical protein SLAV_02845 [Streptomyces lavendulae subsp. lavendulae]|uniref:Uncharacterized protein n=1 Tax=Streptomyces lavendulae subsp. lavendulae TaxID=58340 RepID=A0A2K8P8N2_STRLA|nr:hypothetical protein SLAV_02845 [Streptomyces lavendulae subsp. lavendulae]QUQ52324.1 hypothetical protein SLLC_00880 [Streptomyces lavendulae subsp. lavendulae]
MQSSLELACPPPGWAVSDWPTTRPPPDEGSLDLWLLHVSDAGLRSAVLTGPPWTRRNARGSRPSSTPPTATATWPRT